MHENVDGFTSQESAREIMKHNFLGIEQAVKYFNVCPTNEDIAALAKIPFPKEVLQTHRATHMLVAVFSKTILGMERDGAPFYSSDNGYFASQAFTQGAVAPSWWLVRKTPVEHSVSKILTWDEQCLLLTPNEMAPPAQVLVYMVVGYYLQTGKRLFDDLYVRTNCTYRRSDCYHKKGDHVDVGRFDELGLRMSHWQNDSYRFCLGLSSAYKPTEQGGVE